MISDEELLKHKDHILQHTIDGEEGFNAYLESLHVNIITEDFMCLYVIGEEFIVVYYGEVYNRKGLVQGVKFIKELHKRYTIQDNKPIIYEGINNICKNNSIEIEPNVYQLVLKEFNIK